MTDRTRVGDVENGYQPTIQPQTTDIPEPGAGYIPTSQGDESPSDPTPPSEE